MTLKNALSFLAALAIGLLCVAPPIAYHFDVVVNSFYWTYAVCACGLLAFFLISQRIPVLLKALLVYVFADCYLSQAPYLSFNAFLLLTGVYYFFLLVKECEFKPIVRMVEAAFWLQVAILVVQHFGMDRLMNFDRPGEVVFFGTVYQEMRLSSMFAIMAPILLIRTRWYIVPLMLCAVAGKNLGLTYSLCFGVGLYLLIAEKIKHKWKIILGLLALAIFCSFRAWTHIYVEVIEGRLPVWGVIIRTWYLDTTKNFHGYGSPLNPAVQTGPFDLQRFLFGHGLDTFLNIFPFYKYDPNPFPQAHNDWLQLPWEIGAIGAGVFYAYCIQLIWRLAQKGLYKEIAGLSIVAINMVFAFPFRMTQTWLLMTAYIAYCEKRLCYEWGVL